MFPGGALSYQISPPSIYTTLLSFVACDIVGGAKVPSANSRIQLAAQQGRKHRMYTLSRCFTVRKKSLLHSQIYKPLS